MTQTLDQRRAAAALAAVKLVTSEKDEYRRLAEQTPALIAVNGLLSTMLHLKGKALAAHLESWLMPSQGAPNVTTPRSPIVWKTTGDIHSRLAASTSIEYRHATVEALRYATWLKRWAKALIPANPKTK